MKIETQTHQIESTFVGEDIGMKINREAEIHIMEMLAGLYSNRLLAVLREYSTNALDAHIDAGLSIPFDVTLPTALTPFLKIRDYGNGLDVQGIREIYSQYGASTARKTDDQVGGFGLGAKSGLAYNSKSFTVTSVKDGRRINVLVGLDERGLGRMKVLEPVDGEPTDEANGTTITVAIARDDIDRCAAEAAQFYSYWESGKVLVNGEAPDSFRENALRLTDTMFMVEGGDYDIVVMGNVAYRQPLSLDVQRGYSARFSLVVIVPIGACVPVPSREALKDTPTTKATLAKIGQDFAQAMSGAIQREIDGATDAAHALQTVVQWAKYVPGAQRSASNYKYKGKTMPETYKPALLPSDSYNTVETTDFSTGSHYRGATSKRKDWPSHRWHSTLWLTNFEPMKFNALHKDKIMYYCKEHMIGFRTRTDADGNETLYRTGIETVVICRDAGPQGDDQFFMNMGHVIDFATIKAVKLPKEVLAAGRSNHIAGSFRAYTEDGFTRMMPGDDIRQDKPVFFANCNEYEGRPYQNVLKVFYPEYTFVCLQANRMEKFQRELPKAMTAREGMDQGLAAWTAKLTVPERQALAMFDDGRTGAYRSMDATKVTDPALKTAITVAQRDISAIVMERNVFQYTVDVTVGKVTYPDPLLTKYPLYSPHHLRAHQDEVYEYMNHIYATKG